MRITLSVALVTVGFLGLIGAVNATSQSSDVAVVVNQNNPVRNLSRAELRKLFAGEKHSWGAGLPVTIFVRAPGARERVVLLALLGMSESEYKQYWTTQVLLREAQFEPVALFSNGMQKEAVVTFPGGVALVNAQDVKPGIKVVKVDGRLPGEAGYPLN